jgi:hypothetical protein
MKIFVKGSSELEVQNILNNNVKGIVIITTQAFEKLLADRKKGAIDELESLQAFSEKKLILQDRMKI